MKQNIGAGDTVIRIILSVAIAFTGYYYQSWWGLLAFFPLTTAYLSFCPLYTLLEKKNKTK